MRTIPDNNPIDDFPAVYGHLKRAGQLERDMFAFIGSESSRMIASQLQSFEAPGLAPPVELLTFKRELAEIEGTLGALLDMYRLHIKRAEEALDEALKNRNPESPKQAPF
jgi:hypothetical protein